MVGAVLEHVPLRLIFNDRSPTSAEPNEYPVNIIQAEMYTAFVEMPDVMFQLQKRLLNVRLTFGALVVCRSVSAMS